MHTSCIEFFVSLMCIRLLFYKMKYNDIQNVSANFARLLCCCDNMVNILPWLLWRPTKTHKNRRVLYERVDGCSELTWLRILDVMVRNHTNQTTFSMFFSSSFHSILQIGPLICVPLSNFTLRLHCSVSWKLHENISFHFSLVCAEVECTDKQLFLLSEREMF